MFGNQRGDSDGFGTLIILGVVIIPLLTGIFGDDDEETVEATLDATTSVVVEETVGATDVEPVDSSDELNNTVDKIMNGVDKALQKAEAKVEEISANIEARQKEQGKAETISAPPPESSSEEPKLEDNNPFAISDGFEVR